MNVRNCRKCGKIFNYVSGLPICPACRDEAEKKFQVVKKFIRENPRADIREVAAACEVETSQIQQWSLQKIHRLSYHVRTVEP